jgi:integrase
MPRQPRLEAEQCRVMGRKPSKPNAIPRFRARCRGRVTYYFYDHGLVGGKRIEEPLGKDYGLAIKRWAEIERATAIPPPAVLTFRHVCHTYQREVIPTKAMRTQIDNARELAKLLEFFDDPPAPLDAIRPVNVRQYMAWRSKTAPIRANREKALLSHLWNYARSVGYTDLPNPCAGIKGNRETGRDQYIEDAQFEAIWERADDCLRDAMDLAYLTGQRPADVLRLSEMDVRGGTVHNAQGKTRAKLRIEITTELEQLLARIRERKQGHAVYSTRLIVNEQGRAIGTNAMSRRWARACAAAGITGLQFRDLRAKAATDKEESTGNIREAQRQLGHSNVRMTEHYTRNRAGAKVTPTR